MSLPDGVHSYFPNKWALTDNFSIFSMWHSCWATIFFYYLLTDLIWNCLFSFCSVLTSSAIPATATQSCRHFIFVVHFGKKFWHTKCSLERRKASWHASLISSTVLLPKRRRWESSHPRNLFPDWGKKMVNEYMKPLCRWKHWIAKCIKM